MLKSRNEKEETVQIEKDSKTGLLVNEKEEERRSNKKDNCESWNKGERRRNEKKTTYMKSPKTWSLKKRVNFEVCISYKINPNFKF